MNGLGTKYRRLGEASLLGGTDSRKERAELRKMIRRFFDLSLPGESLNRSHVELGKLIAFILTIFEAI